MARLRQRSSTNCWSALDSSPRRLWLMWAALRPTPRDSRGVELAAWRVRRRATESAPPDMATQMRSPGLMLERSKGSLGETDIWMRIQSGFFKAYGRPRRVIYLEGEVFWTFVCKEALA